MIDYFLKNLKKYYKNKFICIGIVILLLMFSSIFFYYMNFELNDLQIVKNYRGKYPVFTIAIFIIIYALFVFASLPSLPLNLAAGFFWGTFWGGFYTLVGVTIGSLASFNVSRKLIGQPLALPFNNNWVTLFQKEFDKNGWKFIALARINPMVPTGPFNYFMGLTSISTTKFIISTFFFLLPICMFISYIGNSIQALTDQQSFLTYQLKNWGIVILIFSIIIVINLIIKRHKDGSNFK